MNIFSFNGRINRFNFLISTIIFLTPFLLIGCLIEYCKISNDFFLLMIPFGLFFFIQKIKRCHDIGSSGFFALIGVIPLMGFIWIIALLFIKSDKGKNKYGEEDENWFKIN